MYNFAVGKCHWEPSDTADAGCTLTLDCVELFHKVEETFASEIFNLPQRDWLLVTVEISPSGARELQIHHTEGCIPGALFRWSSALCAKLQKVRDQIIAEAMQTLLAGTTKTEVS